MQMTVFSVKESEKTLLVKLLNSPLLVVFWQQWKDTLSLKCISVFNFISFNLEL